MGYHILIPRGDNVTRFGQTRLVLRLDDACATRRRASWDRVERLLASCGVRPIVGVIPDCRDPGLVYDSQDIGFWQRVRAWNDEGWTIALHGETHAYRTSPSGAHGLVPFHASGEYVGRSVDDQRRSIRAAWARFKSEGVMPPIFMAPAHAFDVGTLEALRAETEIRWVTDGISWRPFQRHGFNWLPQQLFRLRSPPALGVWTICLHPNSMTEQDFGVLESAMPKLQALFIDPAEVMAQEPVRHGLMDSLFEAAYWQLAALRWRVPPD